MPGHNTLVGGSNAGTFGLGVYGMDPGSGGSSISDYMAGVDSQSGNNQVTVAAFVVIALVIIVGLHATGFRAMVAVG